MRGIAALTVVWSHYNLFLGFPSAAKKLFEDTPLRFWFDGFAAVSFFFVLSGFVLSRQMIADRKSRTLIGYGPMKTYLIRRWIRIWLPFFAVFLLSLCLIPFSHQGASTIPTLNPYAAGFWTDLPAKRDILKSASLLFLWHNNAPLPQAWSLSVELLFSLFIPFIAFAAEKRPLLIFLAAVIASQSPVPFLFFFHFILGVGLARAIDSPMLFSFMKRKLTLIPLLIIGFILYSSRFMVPVELRNIIGARGEMFWILSGLGSVIFILAALSSPKIQKILSHRVLLRVGEISYSVYLCHIIILEFCTHRFLFALNSLGIRSESTCWIAGLIFTTLCTLSLSGFLHKVVEIPSVRLGRKVSERQTIAVYAQ
jgi:peptidoglycan/LPS O-acetylase OafA/YrhL